MANSNERDNWRTRKRSPDDQYATFVHTGAPNYRGRGRKKNKKAYSDRYGGHREYYYDHEENYYYDSRRYSYDNGVYHDRFDNQHNKQGNKDKDKKKQRPNSCSTVRIDEDGNLSDTSTQSEPPYNERNNVQGKIPFSKITGEERTKDKRDIPPKETRANENRSAQQRDNTSKGDENDGKGKLVKTVNDNPSSATNKDSKKIIASSKTNTSGSTAANKGTTVQLELPQNKVSDSPNLPVQTMTQPTPISPPTAPPTHPIPPTASPKTKPTQSPSSSNTTLPTSTIEKNANKHVETSNNPPNKEVSIDSKNSSLPSNHTSPPKTNTPVKPAENSSDNNQSKIQSNKVINTQDGLYKIPPKRQEPTTDIPPKAPDDPPPPVSGNLNPAYIHTDNESDQLSPNDESNPQMNEPTPNNPEPTKLENPKSISPPTNISSNATNVTDSQQPSLFSTSGESYFNSSNINTGAGIGPNPFMTTQEDPGVNSDTNIVSIFPKPTVEPVTQPNSVPKESSLHSNTLQTIVPIAVEDITEAHTNQNSINTRPSQGNLTPQQCAIDPSSTISASTKSLVSQDTSLLPDSMSNEDPPLEVKVKSLTEELEATKNIISEFETKEKNSLSEFQRIIDENVRITKELEQKKTDILTKDQDKQKVSDELQTEKQQVIKLAGEKKKTVDELKASKKEYDNLKTQVQQSSIDQATIISEHQRENQRLTEKVTNLESKSKKVAKDLTDKEKQITRLKESHLIEITELKKAMDSVAGDSEALSGMEKNIKEKDIELEQVKKELQTARKDKNRLESESKDKIQEINQLKQQLGQLDKEQANLKENISQLEREIDENTAIMKSSVDIELLSKIEEVFIGLSSQNPPSEYALGSPDRVEWLVASLTSWNADLLGKISTNESLLFEKQTEIDSNKEELQTIQNYLQEQMPTNKGSSMTSLTDRPLNLIQIISDKMEQLSKANESIQKIESDKQTMEIQIQDIRQHYNNEDSKNDQLMKDNAALERQIQTLISEKEELEVKNVELINELCELRDGSGNFNNPQSQAINKFPSHVQEAYNPRPSPLYLESTSPFPFDSPASPPPTAFSSLTQGHRSTLQKAADELSHLKVKLWESEAENSKLREQMAVRNRDPTLPATISSDAENAFQAVFEANQSNLLKLSESLREKDMLYKDVEFLRQRTEDLEKNIERHKVSIEVKEVAYKELYTECRDWERKYKKCGQVHHEMERVKRQIMRKEADTQECATLRAERLNQQTTLDNLLAELQERKKIEQNLKIENHNLRSRLDECLKLISGMQLHIQEQFDHKNLQSEEPPHKPPPQPQQEPRPVSPIILKPPSMSSIPLSPPTRQPATKGHPPILYPPKS